MEINKEVKLLNFEDGIKELETIVKTLESGSGDLEDSIKAYERGVALKKHCERKLKEAQEKIEKITMQTDGSVESEDFSTAAAE